MTTPFGSGTNNKPSSGSGSGWAWLVALVLLIRGLLLITPIVVGFVVISSFGAAFIEENRWRVAFGLALSLGVPLLFSWRLRAFLATRRRKVAPPSLPLLVAVCNIVITAVIALGFADDTGRALRRRGDWFLGEESNGWVARKLRAGIGGVALYLERWDPPVELAPVIIAADPNDVPLGPWRPGEGPPTPQPQMVAWFHPLAGPRRALPLSAGRRFGAQRPQPRPAECELGHCGVDLGTTIGEPVFAVFEGVVEKIERDDSEGGRAGRYVRIGHKDGTVVSRYIHLDTIRVDLKVGDRVRGGDLIGRLGASGIHNSGPHLHFGLSLRPGGRNGNETYIDPEPMLRRWELVDGSKVPSAVAKL
jgi:murein DD-endopeptidase MepM/ murein hydrolase activator NlpD